ncbi:hypothetical protein HHI36_008260, partial [Cryptolaemus montrouzieri]
MEQLLPMVKEKEQLLTDLSNSERKKRGIINGIGSIFKTLFGTLDQDDAEYYGEAIHKVETTDQHIVSLLKEQVQIVDSTIRNFNSSITNVEKNNQIFETNFNILYNLTKENSDNFFMLELKQLIEERFSLMTLVTSELNNEYTNLINAILFAKTNQLHPMVITPSQYLIELSKTLPNLPISTSYALPLKEENVLPLLSLVHINFHFSNNKIIFVINTPIISQVKFDLYKLIPIPTVDKT